MSILKSFLANNSGATAIEYGLIASLISVVVISGFNALGSGLTDNFAHITDNIIPVLD